jgi:hypothetical protein
MILGNRAQISRGPRTFKNRQMRMKKNSSFSMSARVALSVLFLLSGLALLGAIPLVASSHPSIRSSAQKPAGPAAPMTTPYSGTYDSTSAFPCASPLHTFTVPTGITRLEVTVAATLQSNDLTLTLLYGSTLIHTEDTGVGSEAYIYSPPGGVPAGTYKVQICESSAPAAPSMAPLTYNGTFTIDDTPQPGGSGSPPPGFGPIPPAAQDSGPKVGFENFIAPGVLVPVTTTSAGGQVNSVEWMGRNAGEPSIGNNWLTGVTAFFSDLQTLFVTFNDTCPATGQSSIWVNRAAPTSQAIDSDPIGFVDHQTGRTFAGELTLLSPTCKTSFTDSDGLPTATNPAGWTPTQGSGFASGVDHETIGGGIYNASSTPPPPPHPAYANAVYYCSQEGVPNSGPPSFCSRSDDGGLTFGPSIPTTNPPVNVCGGLHGHVKVSPVDGTVYLPFNECNGVGSLLASFDNGITWTIQHVNNGSISAQPSASFQDPAVSIDAAGRVYYIIGNNDSAAAIFTSTDHGATWTLRGDVGAPYGLQNIRYPAATAGDAGRASVSFYGTTTAGDALQSSFNGVWHLYVASTFDGGATWTTTDATPNAPMQRGCIWAKGGASICRNLLDFFDMTVDQNGRVLVGYVNGCEGGNCAQAVTQPDHFGGNAFTTAATIARQSSGRRLIGASPPSTTQPPGMPSVTPRRVGRTINLAWSEADTGNSPITGYQILRGTASNAETLFATVTGTQTGGTFVDYDMTGTGQTTYYYKVQAVNAVGTSCGNNEVIAPYLGNGCTGITIHKNDPSHPEANAGANTPASLLIDYIAVGEPANTNDFLFKMKVNALSTVPPNSRWRIMWNSFSSPGQQYYVGMTTGNTGSPTFEYGTLADAGLPAVFVIAETTVASCSGSPCTLSTASTASSFQADGTITIYAPKSAFGTPPVGDLLGTIGGRTLTGDTSNCATDLPPCTPESKLERSNAFVDHTFIKAQTDNSYPAATYTVLGGNACEGGIVPLSAVSRKTHGGGAGTFDVPLPLSGTVGIECRVGQGTNSDQHQVVVTFPGPIAVSNATVSSGTGSVSTFVVSANQVFVNLSGVANAQTITITLSGVNDGTNVADVSIPMGVLLGDVNANRVVSNTDVSLVKAQVTAPVVASNFREDVNANGVISNTDVSVTKAKVGTTLP